MKRGLTQQEAMAYGFVLLDSSPIPFAPFKGRLGFFNVPNEAVPS